MACGPAIRLSAQSSSPRRFDVCLAPQVLEQNPELLEVVANAGISTVWLAGYFYGYWPKPVEEVMAWRARVEKAGMAAHIVNVPLGHPGDSLGAQDAAFPLTPPHGWRMAVRPDGSTYSGTSLHEPAIAENVRAIQTLRAAGAERVFLDDDFRLATGPGVIGGCFCDEHKRRFLSMHGHTDAQWTELLDDVAQRRLSPLLRSWVEFTCDELTGAFRAMQAAAPGLDLGNMIMYLGAEKAGIRLSDYAGVMLRVGELMFDDKSFGSVKGKTDELFSASFHRRYVQPEFAYSETTAFPADKLSAANMAAKLIISTIADVRSTMYMSGMTPFPTTHWETLAPAMKEQAAMHAKLAGHPPRGPFKHFWGENSRYVGDDKPFSLFLALGVPFEVVEHPSDNGWTFLADADLSITHANTGATFVARPDSFGAGSNGSGNVRLVAETLPELFAFRRSIIDKLAEVPYVVDEKPSVCAWYPSARSALVWNLSESHETLTVRYGAATIERGYAPLGSLLLEL